MKLTNITILALKGMGLEIKERIAGVAGVTVSTVNRWIMYNDDKLTKAAILRVIQEETGLTQEQMLKESDVKEAQSTN